MKTSSPSNRAQDATHIFCDESGGTDSSNATFLASAISIIPAEAQRLIKSFRKATRIVGEIKGHWLTPEHRRVFLDLVAKRGDLVSAVVICSRFDACGGWAMGSLAEIDLYSHLLAEACVALPNLATADHLTVTPDGGRYKKAQLESVRKHLAQVVTARHSHMRTHVAFGDSASLAGLQIADVIANSVFQSFGTTAASETTKELLCPLIACGVLRVHSVRLEGIRPKWLEET